MKKIFYKTFKPIMGKDNREKIFNFIKSIVDEEEISQEERYDLLLYIMYEIHTEWNSLSKLEDLFFYI